MDHVRFFSKVLDRSCRFLIRSYNTHATLCMILARNVPKSACFLPVKLCQDQIRFNLDHVRFFKILERFLLDHVRIWYDSDKILDIRCKILA